MKAETTLLGHPIAARAQWLDSGLDVSVFGGVRTHVGAVTLAEPEGTEHTLERTGHRDAAVSRPWALSLAASLAVPVCVRCGIHYDHATKDQIAQILAVCNGLLAELTDRLLEDQAASKTSATAHQNPATSG